MNATETRHRLSGAMDAPTNRRGVEKKRAPKAIPHTIAVVAILLASAGSAFATPSTTYWTPCTIDIQPAGVVHLGVDDYFAVGATSAVGQFPTDVGLTFGANLTKKLSAEYGVDVLSPGAHPLYFNAKIGFREGVISKSAPAVQVGFFNFGTASNVTNQNIVYLVVGKSLPNGKTRLAAAYYNGNQDVLRDGNGDQEDTGYMIAFDHAIVPGKWVLAGDFASGNNAIGGGGVGIYYYFTKDVSILAGPVWFNDERINGPAKMTVQFDINF
ncbi:MAG: hypothetical protein A2Z18_01535 [Armatimonadetes bacterium RBG_16_58_9]|nr:MAG: hypothetical protein A2Z18_01535 [Armatimonadetes bacterium RBG_16_58_9]